MIYYNDHNPFAAAWLRELILAGHMRGYGQCHLCAGRRSVYRSIS